MHQVCIIYTYFHKLLLSVLNVEILKIARVVVILFFVVSISIYIELISVSKALINLNSLLSSV